MTTTPQHTDTDLISNTASSTTSIAPATTRIALWDLPVRIFHWSFVVSVMTAIVTAEVGGDWMDVHEKAGIVTIGLIAFRLVWALFGSTYARFSHFFPTPSRVKDYLTGRWTGLGHNPIGAFSVFALLGLLLTQAVTGLFANDDISFEGPWSGRVTKELSDSITGFHHQLSTIIFVFLGLHVAAIVFCLLFKKNDLVRPMIRGWKEVDAAFVREAEQQAKKGSWAALIAAIVVAFIAMSFAWGGKGAPASAPVPAAATTSFDSPAATQTPALSEAASKPAASGW